MNEATQIKATTLGGTLFVFLANINNDDMKKTIVLTMIGAVVSFITSLLLKTAIKWWKNRKG